MVRCRCTSLLAAVHWDLGDLSESLMLSVKAFDLAKEVGDLTVACRSAICLLERKSLSEGFNSSLPIAAEARRFAQRCGDPQSMALLHLVHGRLDARAGRMEISQRHFARCRSLLEQDENLWMCAAAYLDESGVLSILRDYTRAIDYAKRGINLAERSGWSKGIVAGAANLAYLYLSTGNARAVEDQLELASRQTFASAAYSCALAETAAKAAMDSGDLQKAEGLLRACQQPSTRVPAWYTLKANETLGHLLLRSGRAAEALDLAAVCLDQAGSARLDPFITSFKLTHVQATTQLGRQVDVDLIPFTAIGCDSPAAEHAAFCNTVAAGLGFINPKRAQEWSARGQRISDAVDGFGAAGSNRSREAITEPLSPALVLMLASIAPSPCSNSPAILTSSAPRRSR